MEVLYGSALLLHGEHDKASAYLGKEGDIMSLNNGGINSWKRNGWSPQVHLALRGSIGVVEGRQIEEQESLLEKSGSSRQLENIGQGWLEHYEASREGEEQTGHWLRTGLKYFQS